MLNIHYTFTTLLRDEKKAPKYFIQQYLKYMPAVCCFNNDRNCVAALLYSW